MSAVFDNTLRLVTELILGAPPDKPFVVAIDGRSGSGKSGFAQRLAENIGCTVVHTDDYYLPMEKRVPDWRKIPCANMDLMRLRLEVLEPFLAGQAGSYQPYDCQSGTYRAASPVPAGKVLLIEGSYSHNKELAWLCDLKIFLTCSPEAQKKRLMAREGDHYRDFEQLWIPLEEAYIDRYDIGRGGLLMDTTAWF